MFRKPLQKSGFTLMELVAIIAIIMLLIALLMPAFRKARQVAQRTKCMHNLEQIGVALRLYAVENGTLLPMEDLDYADGSNGWTNALYPDYVDDERVFDCPAKPGKGTAAKPDYWYDMLEGGVLITEPLRRIAGCFKDAVSGEGVHGGLESKVCLDGGMVIEEPFEDL